MFGKVSWWICYCNMHDDGRTERIRLPIYWKCYNVLSILTFAHFSPPVHIFSSTHRLKQINLFARLLTGTVVADVVVIFLSLCDLIACRSSICSCICRCSWVPTIRTRHYLMFHSNKILEQSICIMWHSDIDSTIRNAHSNTTIFDKCARFVRMINVTVEISTNFPSHAILFTVLLLFFFLFYFCVCLRCPWRIADKMLK